jgi:NAD(P)-dependent dehydrogenase (short-subunit alcohol dehydrogenase family)
MTTAAPTATRAEAMPGLKGKNVLVTGGSSGIGQAIAVRRLNRPLWQAIAGSADASANLAG